MKGPVSVLVVQPFTSLKIECLRLRSASFTEECILTFETKTLFAFSAFKIQQFLTASRLGTIQGNRAFSVARPEDVKTRSKIRETRKYSVSGVVEVAGHEKAVTALDVLLGCR